MIGFSTQKKKTIMYKSSSLLLQLYLHLLHFLIMNKSSYFQKKKSKFSIPWKNSRFQKIQKKKIHQSKFSIPSKKFRISKFFKKKEKKNKRPKFSKKKEKKKEIFKKGLRTRGIGLVLLRLLKKKKSIKIFNSMKKFKIPNFSKKKKRKKIQNFQFLRKIQVFKIQKKKKSSLNSSSGSESYDPLPHSPMMQHQINCPPSVFIEVWSMFQTRGIRQVCQIIFNE